MASTRKQTDSAVLPAKGVRTRLSYRRCGKANCSTCVEGPGHGPYWYASWRDGGRVRSRYLGREIPLEPETFELRVRTLGQFSLRLVDGAEHSPRGRARELFTLLLSAPYGSVGREEIAESIWPDHDSRSGEQNVRVTVAALRRQIGNTNYVRVSGPSVLLTLPAGSRDDQMFEAAARDALATDRVETIERAVALYTGPYLPEDVYSDWTIYRRQVLMDLRREVVVRAAERGIGSPLVRIEALRSALADSRLDEGLTELLMRDLAQAGRRAEAISLFEDLRRRLRSDLDVDPAVSLRQLRDDLAAA